MQRLPQFLSNLSRAPLSSATPYVCASQKIIASPFQAFRINTRLLSSFPENSPHARATEAVRRHVGNVVQLTVDERWRIRSKRAIEDSIANPPADAYAGRSVKNTGNLASTFKSLGEILQRNKVKQQVRMSERHEKKGAKRRRLQSERWRKQFANEVRKKVQLVIKIRDRGA